MNMVKATRRFEEWLRRRTAVVEPDLRTKHKHMAEAAFPFLRATFYRWIQVWPGVCSDLAKAPKVLAVGDLHIENFGTWRDSEGRLIWGVNDFDEAFPMAYTNDLARLAASAMLARDVQHFQLNAADACEAILAGYVEALKAGGCRFVLAETHPCKRWLVRRLGPYCRRIDMENLRKHRNVLQLLHAMGKETANIHLGTKKAARCALKDLKKRPRHWLQEAAQAMVQACHQDWREWKK